MALIRNKNYYFLFLAERRVPCLGCGPRRAVEGGGIGETTITQIGQRAKFIGWSGKEEKDEEDKEKEEERRRGRSKGQRGRVGGTRHNSKVRKKSNKI